MAGHDQDAYADLLLRLCPPSIRGLWSRMHATLAAFTRALGSELARIEARADRALEEAFPDTASETIAAWERVLSITPESGATVTERAAACGARFAARGGPQTPAFIRAVCESFGYAAADVDVIEPASGEDAFRAGVSRCGDSIGGGGAHPHSFLVTYPLPVNPALEALVAAIAPSHTWPYFSAV